MFPACAIESPLDGVQLAYEATYYVVYHLVRALTAVRQGDSFLYWPFLASSLILAVIAQRVHALRRNAPGPTSVRALFGARLWWHRSARADYALYLGNALILPAVSGVLLFSDSDVGRLLEALSGPPPEPDHSAAALVLWRLAFTLAFFVAYDFGRFVAHCLLHDVPCLWEFHKIHHSAEVLTPITSFRAHPVELLIMGWGGALATGLVAWVFHRLAGGAITFYTFLGLHTLIWIANLVGNLRHSPVWISYGPFWGRWLISPAHHQIHHSREPRHWGCNRGFEIAIWDRIYGTLYVPSTQPESFRLGLDDDSAGRFRFGTVYLAPFSRALRVLLRPPAKGGD